MRCILKNLILLCCLLTTGLTAMAVTQKEMEQARTITAFWYLRYANNGAGYMEDAKMPSTMAELEKILKETERNNLKSFNSVSVPTDYSGWDKSKLVAYWGDTFFTSSALSAQGKAARSRVKSKLNAMTVTAPSSEAEKPAEKAEETQPEAKVEEPKEKAPEEAVTPEIPSAAEIVANTESMDSAVSAEADTVADSEEKGKSTSGGTWIYVVALIILVGIVVWLVIFASKTMQDSNRQDSDKRLKSDEEPEPAALPLRGSAAGSLNESAEIRARDREIKGLREECARLGEENSRLEEKLNAAYREIETLRNRVASPAAKAADKPALPVAESVANTRQAVTQGASLMPNSSTEEPRVREIYLGRVNPKGLFVRADKRPVPDKSVFVLTTSDGYTGTYRILQSAEVIERCLDNPDHYLAGGCSAPDILATEEAEQIRTLKPGTAVFENGCWRMVRKTKIVYE